MKFLFVCLFCRYDEIVNFEKSETLTLTDFLEALGRVADMRALPSEEELDVNGFANVFDYVEVRTQGLGFIRV